VHFGEAVRPPLLVADAPTGNRSPRREAKDDDVRIRIDSEATLTSYASIFLPRYSGVRPTIRPAMNIAITRIRAFHRARRRRHEDDLAHMDVEERHQSPIGVNESCIELTAPQEHLS